MGYPKDIDEFTEAELVSEQRHRAKLRAAGLCDYCKRPPTEPSCKFPERHADGRIYRREVHPPASKVNLWAVVDTDNFGGDYPNERFVEDTDTGVTKEVAERIAATHNNRGGVHDRSNMPRYWRVVRLPYKLAPGFQP